jgi:hypothetical protein
MKNLITTLLLVISFTLIAQTPGQNVFDDSYLHEIRFENADTNFWISTKDYQMLNMVVDGNSVDSVGFKRKGNISKYPSTNKYGIKIKTNKYVLGKYHDGIKEFTLHMNYQDPTMMREKLTYDICAEMGLFSLRTAFAKVYINDVYWGLYTIVEGKDEMYKHTFGNRSSDAIESLDFGNMCYYGTDEAEYDYDNPSSVWPRYELSNGDGVTAWPSFINMLDKANNTSNTQYLDTVSKYINIQDFFTYQAINVYLMNMDSYISLKGNQIYVFDTINKIWQVTPWDFNASFGLWETGNYQVDSYSMLPNSIVNGCVASKLNSIPTLKNYYLEAMCMLNNMVCDTAVMFDKIEFFRNQIQQAVYDDTRKVATNADFDNGIGFGYFDVFGLTDVPALKTVLTERGELIRQALVNEGYNCTVGVNEKIDLQNQFVLYPNPSNNFININGDNIKIKNVSIIDLSGRVVLNSSSTSKIDILGLNNGIYILKITPVNGESTFYKIIKE